MQHGATLRLSLLMALGIVAAACGPSTETQPEQGTAGSSGSDFTPGVCSRPQVDSRTGLVRCAEGYQHRPTATACTPLVEGAGGSATAPGAEAAPIGGTTSGCDPAACPGEYAFCETQLAPRPLQYCAVGCVDDSDCGAAQVCVCGNSDSPTGGSCVSAACKTDEDCNAGMLCASYEDGCGLALAGFACQRQSDECAVAADCAQPGTCITSDDGGRACSQGVCGRPFLVRAEARLPTVVATSAWLLAAAPRVDHLSAAERAGLAEHWTKLGQMEHASIAAFARFSLQLLSLGAPPALVEACTQALADETAHTQLCFGIASAYAGRALGPGPLDVSGSLAVTSLADIVDLVLAEGCFGETSAALEALEAADTASDPVIAAAYAQIARDEQRHAELAFRFVAWALEREPAAVRERIEAALRSDFARSHGARSVTEPCLSALIGLSLAA
jgi:hypothetical protein